MKINKNIINISENHKNNKKTKLKKNNNKDI